MTTSPTPEDVVRVGIRSAWQTHSLVHVPRLCLVGGIIVLVVLVGVAALGSSIGIPPLPSPLATLDERLPGIFRLHMAASGLALILFPFALLLRRHAAYHRIAGRAAAGLLMIGAATALPSALASEASLPARLGFIAQALLCMGFLINALQAIRRGDRPSHAHRMLCVAALISGAVVLRLMLFAAVELSLPFDAAYAVIAWLSWMLPLGAVWRSCGRRPPPPRRAA